MAGPGVTLDAQQCGDLRIRERLEKGGKVDTVEHLAQITPAVILSQLHPRPLAHAEAVVLPVLQVSQFRRRREVEAVFVRDPSRLERGLEAK